MGSTAHRCNAPRLLFPALAPTSSSAPSLAQHRPILTRPILFRPILSSSPIPPAPPHPRTCTLAASSYSAPASHRPPCPRSLTQLACSNGYNTSSTGDVVDWTTGANGTRIPTVCFGCVAHAGHCTSHRQLTLQHTVAG